MRLNWKILRLAALLAVCLAAAGCGGLSAGQSASPASFLVPGLLQNDARPAPPERALPADEPGSEVVQS